MIKIKAKIRLYAEGRKTPFRNNYRPLFNFIDEMKTSGQISLKNQVDFSPGETGIVEILFMSKEFLGDGFDVGTQFTFGEGGKPLGDGEVLEII